MIYVVEEVIDRGATSIFYLIDAKNPAQARKVANKIERPYGSRFMFDQYDTAGKPSKVRQTKIVNVDKFFANEDYYNLASNRSFVNFINNGEALTDETRSYDEFDAVICEGSTGQCKRIKTNLTEFKKIDYTFKGVSRRGERMSDRLREDEYDVMESRRVGRGRKILSSRRIGRKPLSPKRATLASRKSSAISRKATLASKRNSLAAKKAAMLAKKQSIAKRVALAKKRLAARKAMLAKRSTLCGKSLTASSRINRTSSRVDNVLKDYNLTKADVDEFVNSL